MTPLDTAAALVVLAAVLGYVNHRIVRLPHSIGLMMMGAFASLALVLCDVLIPSLGLGATWREFVGGIDFRATLLEGMLSFLLFAGALHIDLGGLMERKWTIGTLATIGVLISTLIVGTGFWFLSGLIGIDIPWLWCLVFGALISPTDPVAVIGILKVARVAPSLEAKVAGESLFNDGIGVVVFTILLAAATGTGALSFGGAGQMFVLEALGGAVFGLVIGYIAFLAIRSIDDYSLEVLITLALVMGGYALAHRIHVSGPVAMAVAGLLIGNHGRRLAMSEETAEHLTKFWSLLDEVLNSVLFLLIGLEVVAIAMSGNALLLGVAALLIVYAARAISVGVPMLIIDRINPFSRGAFPILFWGGLRGGISIALALTIPDGPFKDVILTVTYVVVIFSVAVQGSTVSRLARRVTVETGT